MMDIAQIIRFLVPMSNDSMSLGRTQVTDAGIMVWDAALGQQPTNAELAAAELPAAKYWLTTYNRAECSRRIFDRYPAGRQLSALAGLYDSANVATMIDWIAANVAAENTAADLIEAATTVQEVEAVTVAWPV